MSQQKKGRTMTPELLEKLAKAREKGLEVIRAKKEAKQKAKDELMKKTYEIMAKEKKTKKQIEEESEEEESDYSIKARDESPPHAFSKKAKAKISKGLGSEGKTVGLPLPKYSNVKKVKKTKIVYMTDTESDTSEEEIVYVPKKKPKPMTSVSAPKEKEKIMQIQNEPQSSASRYLDLF